MLAPLAPSILVAHVTHLNPPPPVRGTYVSVVQGVSAYVQRLAVRIIRVIVRGC